MPFKTIALSTSFALLATTALSQTTQEDIVRMLTEEGYTRIEIKRTLFGNIKIEGEGPGSEREIVLGKDGTILRDRVELEDDDSDEDDEDLDEDEDEEDDEDEEEDGDDDGDDDEDDSDDDDDSEDDSSDDEGGDDSDDDG
jgi:hypothetical protein